MRGQLGLWGMCGWWALACGGVPPAEPPAPASLTLLHTSDIHSRLWPFRRRISRFEAELGLGAPLALTEVGGVARLATLLARQRKSGGAPWLDSGDALEGAEVFRRFGGHLELELLSSLGLAAMALGNHELSLSASELNDVLAESARFPVLSANVQPRADSPLFGRLVPSAVLQTAGARLGVIGLANPHSPPNLSEPGNPWALVTAPDLASAAQAAIDQLLPQVSLVIVLSHLGLDQDRALVAATSGIDLVLGGHQHIVTPEPEWQDDCASAALQAERGCSPRRVPIVHSGAYSQWLSRVELRLEPAPGDPQAREIAELTLTQLPLAAEVPLDAKVARFLEARRPPPLPPLAYLPDGVARRSALRDELQPGVLLQSDLELAFPFDEPWRLVWLSGRALRQGLERAARRSATQSCASTLQVSGIYLKLHCAACIARNASCLEVLRPGALGEASLDDSALVLTALPEYLTLGGADFDAVGPAGAELDGDVLSVLSRYFQTLPRENGAAACRAALLALPDVRCREAFGALECPLSVARADAVCRGLPSLKGARDGRIEMLP